MKFRLSTVVPLSLFVAAFTFAASVPANAQNQSAAEHLQPPNILIVNTEMVKPGSMGSAHEKSEAAIADLLRNANSNAHYLGLVSLTGQSRAVFLAGYDSFGDWQKTTESVLKDASLSSSLDADAATDGAMLDGYMTSVYHFRKDLSLNPGAPYGSRFFELTLFRVRSGHEKDWESVVKMYQAAYAKIPGSHWDMFEKLYGEHSGDTWLLAIPMKSLAYEDESMADNSKLKDVVGADQLQKMRDLGNAAIESIESNIFYLNPKMSYEPPSWTKANATVKGQ